MNKEDKRRLLQAWRDDRGLFSRQALRIRAKDGRIVQFQTTGFQDELNRRLDQQREELGCVRALVVKGRQMGISTTIAARFWHAVIFNPGMRVAIMCHQKPATENLSKMAAMFLDYLPPWSKPGVRKRNTHEILLNMGSQYQLSTAGSAGAGRSSTINLFHGSEVAFWDRPEEHLAGIGQTILEGTGEIILESTGNGVGNAFHQDWQAAERKETEYLPIFLPWFLMEEYRVKPPRGFQLGNLADGDMESERDYARLHKLDHAQMAWRRRKLSEFSAKGTPNLFMQEYPAVPQEAFQGGAGAQFIPSRSVMEARRRDVSLEDVRHLPLIIGVDPAWSKREAADSSAVIRRRGRKAYGLETFHGMDGHDLAQKIATIAAAEQPARIVVDRNGVGASCLDHLRRMAPSAGIVTGFHAGERALDQETHVDRRTEVWSECAGWLEEDADIPDDDALASELLGPRMRKDARNRNRLEDNASMKKRGLRSPDRASALVHTFAFHDPPVAEREDWGHSSRSGDDWSPFDDYGDW